MINAESKQGPLVGEKKSSRAITEEYAKADPVYVAKTAVSSSAHVNYAPADYLQALPQKFSHYRQILGDGNCGWRGKLLPHRPVNASLSRSPLYAAHISCSFRADPL
jgi:Peptidase C65 Otubain